MTSPIARMIDASGLVCTLCGARKGHCDCWERRADRQRIVDILIEHVAVRPRDRRPLLLTQTQHATAAEIWEAWIVAGLVRRDQATRTTHWSVKRAEKAVGLG